MKDLQSTLKQSIKTSVEKNDVALAEATERSVQQEESRSKILVSLNAYFLNTKVEKAWVFGSFARKADFTNESDIDLMVVFKKNSKVTLFDLVEMKQDLSQLTGRLVDIVEEGRELKSFSQKIRKERVLVYGN